MSGDWDLNTFKLDVVGMTRLHIKVFFNDYFALQIRLVRGQQPTRDAAHSASVSFMKTLNNNENNERKKKKKNEKDFKKKIRLFYGV